MNDSRELHAEKARPDEGITAQDDPTEKIEMNHLDLDLKAGAHKSVGLAVIGQTHTIPTTGERKVTTKMEYWTYCIFCEYICSHVVLGAFADTQTSVHTEIVRQFIHE